ncbi:HNH endonuclease [Brumicola pallidula]|uniref:HNH domain-containing protein n=1 Tax=Brumicola pallidula DSM 14239 = ACAM 615 TaxID=1121922 RepID=K6Z322_9ALTE|nr:HNH endonuclease [Glaciecola pallidula]GAC30641.1 hypothetical protein GPAL_3801 [Glaciecola pallidula DSM 14239 = ACAM 615]
MHYIKRSELPELLENSTESWTQPWIDYYRWIKSDDPKNVHPVKPTDGHWRKDDIRLKLINDFHNNCGYCGNALPTPSLFADIVDELNEEGERVFASKGDVDHFLPKAIYPEKVYDWINYIWSCKPCNQLKLEFEDIKYPLLNPCEKSDCQQLIYLESSGQYGLKNVMRNNKYWQKRFKNSQIKTLMNAIETGQERALKISVLRQCFESIVVGLTMLKKLQLPEIEKHIDKDVRLIKKTIVSPNFHYLLQEYYQLLQDDYPQVVPLLNE